MHILPMLLHSSEMLTLLADDSPRLQSFHVSYQSQILRMRRHHCVKNSLTDVSATTSLPNVDDTMAKKRLALFGHVVRLDANGPAHLGCVAQW